jgi:tRNA threonylcarbamoyladenosine biosynthesis protein TsaB
MKLLALDTVTEYCSAALSIDGELLSREILAHQSHTEMILPMVEELLAEAEIHLQNLDAIAFDRGPGSFTGLRIGAGITQGLALGSGLPVIPVSSLQTIAQTVLTKHGQTQAITCIDARQGEIYWGCFTEHAGIMRPDGNEQIGHPGSVSTHEQTRYGAGSGFATFENELVNNPRVDLSGHDNSIYPLARDLVPLAVDAWRDNRYVDAGNVLPVYLRDKVAKIPGQQSGEEK